MSCGAGEWWQWWLGGQDTACKSSEKFFERSVVELVGSVHRPAFRDQFRGFVELCLQVLCSFFVKRSRRGAQLQLSNPSPFSRQSHIPSKKRLLTPDTRPRVRHAAVKGSLRTLGTRTKRTGFGRRTTGRMEQLASSKSAPT